MREDWTGFYGPAYRLMLEYADCRDLPEVAWTEAVRMHSDNPIGEEHWEFLAIGYLHLFDCARYLSSTVTERLSDLLPRFCSEHHATNWRLMAQVVRCRIEGRFLTSLDLAQVRLKPADDGFLPDIPGDESSQYHAFLLFLLMRFSDPTDSAMRTHVTRALNWLEACHRRFGDPSPLGRGRFQLFGYAAMAAAAAQAERWNLAVPSSWHSDIWKHLEGEYKSGAVSPRWDGPHRHYLLHGYNTVEDYPAFASLITHTLKPAQQVPDSDDIQVCWWHPLDTSGSGLLADRNGVLVSILVSQTADSVIGVRHMFRQLVRRPTAVAYRPYRVSMANPLPSIDIWMHEENRNLHFDWTLEQNDGQMADMTLWSCLPLLNFMVTGSVESACLNWQNTMGRMWHGINLRSARVGSAQLTWECP